MSDTKPTPVDHTEPLYVPICDDCQHLEDGICTNPYLANLRGKIPVQDPHRPMPTCEGFNHKPTEPWPSIDIPFDRRHTSWWWEEKDSWQHLITREDWENWSTLSNDRKIRYGLASFPYTKGDPKCPTCMACRCYKTCSKESNGPMWGQNTCASHQISCGKVHPDRDEPQCSLEEFC